MKESPCDESGMLEFGGKDGLDFVEMRFGFHWKRKMKELKPNERCRKDYADDGPYLFDSQPVAFSSF